MLQTRERQRDFDYPAGIPCAKHFHHLRNVGAGPVKLVIHQGQFLAILCRRAAGIRLAIQTYNLVLRIADAQAEPGHPIPGIEKLDFFIAALSFLGTQGCDGNALNHGFGIQFEPDSSARTIVPPFFDA